MSSEKFNIQNISLNNKVQKPERKHAFKLEFSKHLLTRINCRTKKKIGRSRHRKPPISVSTLVCIIMGKNVYILNIDLCRICFGICIEDYWTMEGFNEVFDVNEYNSTCIWVSCRNQCKCNFTWPRSRKLRNTKTEGSSPGPWHQSNMFTEKCKLLNLIEDLLYSQVGFKWRFWVPFYFSFFFWFPRTTIKNVKCAISRGFLGQQSKM